MNDATASCRIDRGSKRNVVRVGRRVRFPDQLTIMLVIHWDLDVNVPQTLSRGRSDEFSIGDDAGGIGGCSEVDFRVLQQIALPVQHPE